MTISLNLPDTLEKRLRSDARKRSMDIDEYAIRLLEAVSGFDEPTGNSPDLTVARAVSLYDLRLVSLETGANIAGLTVSDFIDALGQARVPVFQYTASEALSEARIR